MIAFCNLEYDYAYFCGDMIVDGKIRYDGVYSGNLLKTTRKDSCGSWGNFFCGRRMMWIPCERIDFVELAFRTAAWENQANNWWELTHNEDAVIQYQNMLNCDSGWGLMVGDENGSAHRVSTVGEYLPENSVSIELAH